MEAILKEAMEIDVQIEDRGASNLDECIIAIKDSMVKKMSGVNLIKLRKDTYILGTEVKYQGLARTKLAEAVCDYLNTNGIKAYVEYTLD